MSEQPSTIALIILVLGSLPSIYFLFKVIQGIILTIRQPKDDEL